MQAPHSRSRAADDDRREVSPLLASVHQCTYKAAVLAGRGYRELAAADKP